MIGIKDDTFPLSKTKKHKGYRKLARVKVLQILTAYELSGIDWQHYFSHIFFRDFNFGDDDDMELPEFDDAISVEKEEGEEALSGSEDKGF